MHTICVTCQQLNFRTSTSASFKASKQTPIMSCDIQRAKYTAHASHLKIMHGFAHNWVWPSLQLILSSSTVEAGLVQACRRGTVLGQQNLAQLSCSCQPQCSPFHCLHQWHLLIGVLASLDQQTSQTCMSRSNSLYSTFMCLSATEP